MSFWRPSHTAARPGSPPSHINTSPNRGMNSGSSESSNLISRRFDRSKSNHRTLMLRKYLHGVPLFLALSSILPSRATATAPTFTQTQDAGSSNGSALETAIFRRSNNLDTGSSLGSCATSLISRKIKISFLRRLGPRCSRRRTCDRTGQKRNDLDARRCRECGGIDTNGSACAVPPHPRISSG